MFRLRPLARAVVVDCAAGRAVDRRRRARALQLSFPSHPLLPPSLRLRPHPAPPRCESESGRPIDRLQCNAMIASSPFPLSLSPTLRIIRSSVVLPTLHFPLCFEGCIRPLAASNLRGLNSHFPTQLYPPFIPQQRPQAPIQYHSMFLSDTWDPFCCNSGSTFQPIFSLTNRGPSHFSLLLKCTLRMRGSLPALHPR